MSYDKRRAILLIPIYWREHCIGQIDAFTLAEYRSKCNGDPVIRVRIAGDDIFFRKNGPVEAVLVEPKPETGWVKGSMVLDTYGGDDRFLDPYDMVLACKQLADQIKAFRSDLNIFAGDTKTYIYSEFAQYYKL